MDRLLTYLTMGLVAASVVHAQEAAEQGAETPAPRTTGDYLAPADPDDYSALADWEKRGSWNLANVHDPTVVWDGTHYYMYGTDASYGNAHLGHGHFPYRRSKDLVHWEFMGMAMPETPAWVRETLNQVREGLGLTPIAEPVFGYWAPVITRVGSTYRLYYSIIVDHYIQSGLPNTEENFDGSWTERAFIGLMETDDLGGNRWTDRGLVVSSVSDRGTDWSRRDRRRDWDGYFRFNAIDPTYLRTPGGDHYLVYGSWHSGIAALQLDPETGKPPKPPRTLEEHGRRVAARFLGNPDNRWQGMEAPEAIYNEATGYYYLFLAYDELSVAYNTRVCRSKSPLGPYLGIDGSNVTEGAECWPILTHPYRFDNHSGWVGISHCCVFRGKDEASWFYVSQGRLPHNTNGNAYSNAIMRGHLRKIRWTEDGWPVVMPQRYAGVPQDPVTAEDLAGAWEHILLDHEYRRQRTSSRLDLRPDGTAAGALSGPWTYDPERSILTIGTQQLCVERELDWEASPRVPTIVYAGLNEAGRSLWGKKVTEPPPAR